MQWGNLSGSSLRDGAGLTTTCQLTTNLQFKFTIDRGKENTEILPPCSAKFEDYMYNFILQRTETSEAVYNDGYVDMYFLSVTVTI